MGCLTMPKGVRTKRYAPEFKKLVVETMQKENLSDCGTARLLTERKKRDAENTAKPRRNCSGEALLLTT